MKKMRLLVGVLFTFSVACASCQTATPKASPAPPPRITEFGDNKGDNFHLHILGINDLHGQLDVTRKVNGKNAGRADYLAAYLKQRQAQYKDVLLVHAGDAVGASAPVSALLQEEPTIQILNAMGFNADTLGNHQFDRNVTEMLRLIQGGDHSNADKHQGAKFPYVCANDFAFMNPGGIRADIVGRYDCRSHKRRFSRTEGNKVANITLANGGNQSHSKLQSHR